MRCCWQERGKRCVRTAVTTYRSRGRLPSLRRRCVPAVRRQWKNRGAARPIAAATFNGSDQSRAMGRGKAPPVGRRPKNRGEERVRRQARPALAATRPAEAREGCNQHGTRQRYKMGSGAREGCKPGEDEVNGRWAASASAAKRCGKAGVSCGRPARCLRPLDGYTAARRAPDVRSGAGRVGLHSASRDQHIMRPIGWRLTRSLTPVTDISHALTTQLVYLNMDVHVKTNARNFHSMSDQGASISGYHAWYRHQLSRDNQTVTAPSDDQAVAD